MFPSYGLVIIAFLTGVVLERKVFVGLKNYIELVTQDEVFRATIGHTLVYTVINVAIQVFGGLLFAILLSRIKKGRVALQTLYYIPVVISSVAICQIFTKLLSSNSKPVL